MWIAAHGSAANATRWDDVAADGGSAHAAATGRTTAATPGSAFSTPISHAASTASPATSESAFANERSSPSSWTIAEAMAIA